MLSRLFIAALWSPAGKGLTSKLSFVMFNCVFITFPCGILGQLWYLIVSIPDLCHLSYFPKAPLSDIAINTEISCANPYVSVHNGKDQNLSRDYTNGT